MLTRKTRENRLTSAKMDLLMLKEDLINDEVVESAVNLHSLLATISHKYSNDAIVDLIPELTKLLNRLDACIKVNADFKDAIIEITDENTFLKNQLSLEKINTKRVLEESLSCEEKADDEIERLKSDMQIMYDTEFKLKKELESQNEIITILQSDIQELNLKLDNRDLELSSIRSRLLSDGSYKTPKKTMRTESILNDFTIETNNGFLPLSISSNSESTYMNNNNNNTITVTAQVHRENTYSPELNVVTARRPTIQKTNQKYISKPTKNSTSKRRIVVLADSHGRDLHKHFRRISEDYDIYIHTKPGAKLKTVIKEGLPLIQHLTKDDYVIILAGTNDLNDGEPGQLTVNEGLRYLLKSNINSNVIMNSIPYRYDSTHLNDNIYFVNSCITSTIRKNSCTLNMIYGEINSLLLRHHYTTHGLHLNRRGKNILASAIIDCIQRRSTPVTREGNVRSSRQMCGSNQKNADQYSGLGKTGGAIPCGPHEDIDINCISDYSSTPERVNSTPPLDCLTPYPQIVSDSNLSLSCVTTNREREHLFLEVLTIP